MGYRVVVAGATGNVGREMLNILAERHFPVDEIAALVAAHADRSSAEISAALMRALERLDDPDQDNTSICVIRVAEKSRAPAQVQTQAATAPDKRKRSTVAFMATKGKSKNIRTYRVSLEKSA